MPKIRESGLTRANKELYATLKSLMIKKDYNTIKDFSRRVHYSLNYQLLRMRISKPTTFRFDELLLFVTALQMPAEDFGEMCKNAYAEFKKLLEFKIKLKRKKTVRKLIAPGSLLIYIRFLFNCADIRNIKQRLERIYALAGKYFCNARFYR